MAQGTFDNPAIVEEELDIPTLDIEGRMSDSSPEAIEEMHARLSEFIDLALARKG